MSTQIAYGADAIPETRGKAKSKSAGWLRRLYDRLVAAREAQVSRYVADYLANMSDARLAELGYTDDQIRHIRTERRLPKVD